VTREHLARDSHILLNPTFRRKRSYKEFYALIWTGHIPRPTHAVPLRKVKRYTAQEAAEIIRKVKDYKDAVKEVRS
jgi:hypothetical protein